MLWPLIILPAGVIWRGCGRCRPRRGSNSLRSASPSRGCRDMPPRLQQDGPSTARRLCTRPQPRRTASVASPRRAQIFPPTKAKAGGKRSYHSPPSPVRRYGMKFFETSARANTNVTEAFMTLATDVVDRLLAGGGDQSQAGVNVSQPTKQTGSSGCC